MEFLRVCVTLQHNVDAGKEQIYRMHLTYAYLRICFVSDGEIGGARVEK